MKVTIPVQCMEEKKVVGHLELANTSTPVKLDLPVLLSCFVPISQEYRLSGGIRGKILKCSKCGHALAISGEMKTYEHKATFKTDAAPIIIGVTRTGAK